MGMLTAILRACTWRRGGCFRRFGWFDLRFVTPCGSVGFPFGMPVPGLRVLAIGAPQRPWTCEPRSRRAHRIARKTFTVVDIVEI